MKRKFIKKAVMLIMVMTMVFGMTMGVSANQTTAPEDGVYTIGVTSSAPMFRVVNAVLTSEDGVMTSVITLSGTGYPKLYMGTGEEAVNSDESDYIYYEEDKEGKYTFEIPVISLDNEISVAAYSTKNKIWYDRELTFNSDSLLKISPTEKVTLGGETNEEVKIDINTLSFLGDSEVTFNTAAGSIVFDREAMGGVVENAAGSVTLLAKIITNDEKYSSSGYDFVIELKLFDSKENALFTSEGNGKATITVPYTNDVPLGKSVKVYYLTDSGKEAVDAVYDAENKSVTFEVLHFSEYAIAQEDDTQPVIEENNIQESVDQTGGAEKNAVPKTGDFYTGWKIITLFMALILSAGVLFKNRRTLNLK